MDSDSQLLSSNLSSSKNEDSTLLQNNNSTTNEDSTLLHNNNSTTNGQTSTLLSTGTTTDFDSTTNFSSTSLTDLTSGLSSSNLTETDADKSRNVTRELIVKKQLLHDIQKLKIELSQKNLLIDTLKADHLNQIDDIEDKLADAIHKKQLSQAQCETQIRLYKNDTEKRINALKNQLQGSMRAQKSFQRKYEDMANKKADLRIDFVQSELSEDEYLELKGKSEESISPQDFFNVSWLNDT